MYRFCAFSIGAKITGAHAQNDVTELNLTDMHGLVFDELTNEQAERARCSLVDAYVRQVT